MCIQMEEEEEEDGRNNGRRRQKRKQEGERREIMTTVSFQILSMFLTRLPVFLNFLHFGMPSFACSTYSWAFTTLRSMLFTSSPYTKTRGVTVAKFNFNNIKNLLLHRWVPYNNLVKV